MRMTSLRDRTRDFAVRIVRMYDSLPKTSLAQILGKQALRSGTGVAANFREASRARSDREFVAKLGVVEQELDEVLLWFDLLIEAKVLRSGKLSSLQDEAEHLLKIVVSTVKKTARPRKKPP